MSSSGSAVWGQRIERDPQAGSTAIGGDGRPKTQGGDRLSQRTEVHGDLIRALLAEVPDITLPKLKERLTQAGAFVSIAALWRFCKRHKLTRQKRLRMQASRIATMS